MPLALATVCAKSRMHPSTALSKAPYNMISAKKAMDKPKARGEQPAFIETKPAMRIYWPLKASLGIANGGVLNPFEFESSTLTILLQQIIALKTIESKFYVATSCAALISALSMTSIIVTEVPYQTRVRIPVWDSLETHHSSRSGSL